MSKARASRCKFFFSTDILSKVEDFENEIRKNELRNQPNIILPIRKASSKTIYVTRKVTNRTLKVKLRVPQESLVKNISIDLSTKPKRLETFLSDIKFESGVECVGSISYGITDFNQQAVGAGLTLSPILGYSRHLEYVPQLLKPNRDCGNWIKKILKHIYARGEKADVYKMKFPAYFYKFVKALKMYRGFSKFLEICTAVSVSLLINDVPLDLAEKALLDYIIAVENSFHGQRNGAPPGVVFIAPPGMGKTVAQFVYPYGMLDTDNLNTELLDADPTIIDNLVNNGITVITNRWDFKRWTSFKIAAFPKDLKETMKRKGFCFTENELAEVIAARNALSRKQIKKPIFSRIQRKHPDGRKWIEAYKDVKTYCDLYIEGPDFIHCLDQFHAYCLNLTNAVEVTPYAQRAAGLGAQNQK